MPKDRNPRRRPETERRRPDARRGFRWRWLAYLLPILLVAAGTYGLLRSPWLSVRTVRVAGAGNLDRAAVAEISGLEGKSMLALPLEDARRKLLAIPQVKSVSFRRSWPDEVVIAVKERQPAAFWSVSGRDYPVDEEGVVLAAGAPDGPAPRIVETGSEREMAPGDRVPAEALTLARRVLEEAPRFLNRNVEQFEYRAGVGLTADFAGGLRVTFGDERAYEYKVAVLAELLETLSAEGKPPKAVDLRFGDRVTYE